MWDLGLHSAQKVVESHLWLFAVFVTVCCIQKIGAQISETTKSVNWVGRLKGWCISFIILFAFDYRMFHHKFRRASCTVPQVPPMIEF